MTLQEAILQRKNEIAARRKDLSDPEYTGKDWAAKEIEQLSSEIGHLEVGEIDKLAKCIHGVGRCLIAHKRFDSCILRAVDCEFYYYQPDVQVQQARQEELSG